MWFNASDTVNRETRPGTQLSCIPGTWRYIGLFAASTGDGSSQCNATYRGRRTTRLYHSVTCLQIAPCVTPLHSNFPPWKTMSKTLFEYD
jgi:hypothetical protein